MFVGKLSAKQVIAVYRASDNDFSASLDCLLAGPTLSSIVGMLNDQFEQRPAIKVKADPEDIWQDMVAQYKSPRMDMTKQLRVTLHNQPALDTGGVRRQVYTSVYSDFLSNKYTQLFDGPPHRCRPLCTSESRSSGLFKVMGTMVAHSIAQDGIGFLHFSPVCYWYIVGGEERGIEFVSEDDLGGDVAEFVSKVCYTQKC